MNEIELTLPYPPSVNHYKNVGRLITTQSGKLLQQRINSPKTNAYYLEVWTTIQNLKALKGLKSFDNATISVELDVFPPDKRKRDLDGILKVFIDALQYAQLFKDDYQIARLVVERKGIIVKGQIICRIKAYE